MYKPVGLLACFLLAGALSINVQVRAQEPEKKDVHSMTKDDVMEISFDDLLEMNLEQLLEMANKAGVSTEELLQMALNRKSSIASRRAESVFVSPLSTYVITREDIEHSGYSSVAQLFNLVPGAIVRQKTNGNYDVTFRGMDNVPPENYSVARENSTLLLMVDNQVMYNHFTGGTFWETLPIGINDIERIEVVRGAASALYGPNATTGVINIITRGAAMQSGVAASASYGMHNSALAGVNGAISFGNGWSARLNGNFELRDRQQDTYFDYLSGEYLPRGAVRNYMMSPLFEESRYNFSLLQLGGKDANPLRTDRRALVRYGANANLYYAGRRNMTGRLMVGVQESEAQTISLDNFVTPINFRTSKSLVGSGLFTYKGWYAQANYQGGRQDLAADVAVPVLPRYAFTNFDAQIGSDFDLAKGLMVQPQLGYSYVHVADRTHRNDNSHAQQGYINGERTLQTASISVRTEYRPIEALRFIAGSRYDYYLGLKTGTLAYQLVASYAPNENHLIRANYSRASRGLFIPSLYADIQDAPMTSSELERILLGYHSKWFYHNDLIDTIYTLSIRGNTGLKPPKFDMCEVGYRWKITDQYQLEIEGFYSTMRGFDSPEIEIQERVAIRPGEDFLRTEDKRSYRNMRMRAHQFGGTLAFTAMPISSLTLRGHITFQQTMLRNYTVNDGVRSVNEFGTIKYLTKTIDMPHEWTPRFFAGLSASYYPLEDKSLAIYADALLVSRQLYRYRMLVKGIQGMVYDELPLAVRGNISVSYRIVEPLTLFVAAHNIGLKARQYAFGDAVGTSFHGGVRFALN